MIYCKVSMFMRQRFFFFFKRICVCVCVCFGEGVHIFGHTHIFYGGINIYGFYLTKNQPHIQLHGKYDMSIYEINI